MRITFAKVINSLHVKDKNVTVPFGIQCKYKCFFSFLEKKLVVTLKNICKQLTFKVRAQLYFIKGSCKHLFRYIIFKCKNSLLNFWGK